MRATACHPSVRCALAGFALLLTARPGAAELVVSTLVPARNTTAASTTAVSVTFNQAVNTATVSNASFRVFGRNSGPASGTFSFSNANQTVTLTPSAPFAAGEVVTVNLAETLEAADTTSLRTEGYAWQFAIATAPAALAFTEIDEFGNKGATPQTRIYGAMASDLDNDGWTDLMTVNEVSADIRVFMNLGAAGSECQRYGSFLTPQTIGVEASPNEAGDFDNDGNVDSAISAALSDTVSIALGAGNGMFAITQITVGDESHGVVVLDVDGDGDSDVVNANHGANNLSLLINNGAGVFAAPTFFGGCVSGPWGLAAGDMNNDGIMDLVAGGEGSQQICTLLGNGDGTFTASTPQAAGGPNWVVVVGDVDGDGNLDAAAANAFVSNGGAVLLGNGDGTFDPPVTLATGAHTPSADLGDLDGDGDLDLVLSVFGGGYWRVFTNNGTGTFTQVQQITATSNPSCSILVDFDNDGDLDMALTDEIADTVRLMQNGAGPQAACPPTPEAGCRQPFLGGKAFLLLKDRTPDTSDRLLWKWLVGTQTDKTEFGNPLTTESYRLCVYDAGSLAMGACAGASSTFWRETTPGFVFKNPATTAEGTSGMLLKSGTDRKAKIIVKGKGEKLDMPDLNEMTGPIDVRLHQSSDNVCWGATYSMPFLRQDPSILKDKAD